MNSMSGSCSTPPLPEVSSLDFSPEIEKIAYLIVNDRRFEVNVGETKIGRDASCNIILEDEYASRFHVVLESDGPENTFMYDVGSRNKTKLGRTFLKPHCRYKVSDGDFLIFGKVPAKFQVVNKGEPLIESPSFELTSKSSESGDRINLDDSLLTPSSLRDEEFQKKKTVSDVFKVPSQAVFKKPSFKHKKKEFYASVNSADLDIFNQATQCEVEKEETEMKSESGFKCKVSEDFDDVFSLETQLGEGQLDNSPKFKPLECSFNDSGRFSFVKPKTRNKFIPYIHQDSFDEDIFDSTTQCPVKSEEGNEALSFKNKVISNSSSVNGIKVKLESDNVLESEIKPVHKVKGIDKNYFCEDEELFDVSTQKVVQSSTFGLEKTLKTGKDKSSIEDKVSDDIFNIPTQKNFDVTKTVTNTSSDKQLEVNPNHLQLGKNVDFHEDDVQKFGNYQDFRGKTDSTISNPTEEDMICTQVFTLPKINKKQDRSKSASEGVIERKKPEVEKIVRNFVDEHVEEDFIATQFFDFSERHDDDLALRESPNSEDDMLTQMFPHSQYFRKINEADNNPSNFTNDTPKSVKNSVQKCNNIEAVDSGDETGSDLDEELIVSFQKHTKKSDVPSANNPKSPESVSSDKTVSDIDIAEAQRVDCVDEDFIATQAFDLGGSDKNRTVNNEPRFAGPEGGSNEDFIATQIFPQSNQSVSSNSTGDKTDLDVEVCENFQIEVPELETINEDDITTLRIEPEVNDDSSESISLLKDMQEDSSSSEGIIPVSQKRLARQHDLRIKVESSEETCSEPSPSLLESHPVFDTLSEVDELIGRNENNPLDCFVKVDVEIDSDETDEEQVLEGLKQQFGIRKDDADGPSLNFDKLPEELTSTPEFKICLEKTRKSGNVSDKISSNKVLVSEDTIRKRQSPLKRTRERGSGGAVPKKKDRREAEGKRGKRVGPKNSSRRKTDATKTPGKDCKLLSEVDLSNILGGGSRRSSLQEPERTRRRTLRSDSNKGKVADENSRFKVVFTGFESDYHNRMIEKVGGLRENDLKKGQVLVTDKVRRTVKFLCAIAMGIPIVSPKWIVASEKEMKFLDPWHYILKDREAEGKWGFNLRTALEKGTKRKLLKGYSVHATPGTKPPVPEILDLVSCCGGNPLSCVPTTWPEKSFVLSCLEDRKYWPHIKHKHVRIVHYELLLSGVLRQELDFKTYKLR